MLEHIRATERDTRKFRLLALTFCAAGLYLAQDEISLFPALGLITAYFIYTLLLPGFILNKVNDHRVIYGMIGVDALALSGGLYLAGVGSPVFILLPLFIVYYSIYFGYTSSLVSAILFSFVYSGLTFIQETARATAHIIALQVPFLFILALLGGYLSQRRIQERREKEELQEIIKVESQARELLEMAKRMGQTWEMETILGLISRYSPRLLGFPHCLVALVENGKLLPKGGNIEFSHSLDVNEPLTSLAFRKGAPLAEEENIPSWAQERGASALLVIPLAVKKERIGAIYLFDTSPHPIGREQIRLAQGYSELISNALFNAQLYQRAEVKLREVTNELESAILRLERFEKARRRGEIVVGDIRIDGIKEEAFLRGEKLNLTPIEFELLYALAEHAGQPLNPQTLLRRIWGKDQGTSLVDVSIHRLRKKLGDFSYRVLTIRGKGYMLQR
jgi:hypothetical protein